ncbi:transposase [Acetobacter sicerae]|nr:transposase [Acetobacter sicerae]
MAEAKRGFVLLPRRWGVERSFSCATRCRRLAKDYDALCLNTPKPSYVIAFACFLLKNTLYSL